MAEDDSREERPNKGLLAKLFLGITPIPVVGDVCLVLGFKDIMKDYSLFRNSAAVGFSMALLTRALLYSQIYFPLYKAIGIMQ